MCLKRTLGSVTFDAYTVYLFADQREDRKQALADFLKCYTENTFQRQLLLVDKLTEEEAVSITAFHFRYIKTLAENYTRWMLANIDEAKDAATGSYSYQPSVMLTSTETMRVTRVIYRFQLLCYLASTSDKCFWLSRNHRNEILQAFLHTLEPWEVEELYSFYQ